MGKYDSERAKMSSYTQARKLDYIALSEIHVANR